MQSSLQCVLHAVLYVGSLMSTFNLPQRVRFSINTSPRLLTPGVLCAFPRYWLVLAGLELGRRSLLPQPFPLCAWCEAFWDFTFCLLFCVKSASKFSTSFKFFPNIFPFNVVQCRVPRFLGKHFTMSLTCLIILNTCVVVVSQWPF